MQLGVVPLEEAMADNFSLIPVQQTVVALLIQRCEQLGIWNVRQSANQTREIAVGVGMPCPPASVRNHFRRMILLCDRIARHMRKKVYGR